MNILLIASSPNDLAIVNSELIQATGPPYTLEHVDSLSSGLQRLRRGGVNALITNLCLPDSNGIETFRRLHQNAPDLPIFVLLDMEDESIGRDAVSEGAQRILFKSEISGCRLLRKLRDAIQCCKKRREPAAFAAAL